MNVIKPNWPAPSHVKAYTTVKHAWGNEYYHEIDDDLFAKENQKLKTLLQLPHDPIWIKQKHTNIVIPAHHENKYNIADASYAHEADQICVVMTADCLPILICNQKGSHIAAIHAGWRGLSAGIIEATLTALNQPPEELMVWLGPAISAKHYEVGCDVYQAFTAYDHASENALMSIKKGKWLANLYELAKIRLHAKGIHAIYGGNYCTYQQKDLFFSYRRDQGKTGRMATLIWYHHIQPK